MIKLVVCTYVNRILKLYLFPAINHNHHLVVAEHETLPLHASFPGISQLIQLTQGLWGVNLGEFPVVPETPKIRSNHRSPSWDL